MAVITIKMTDIAPVKESLMMVVEEAGVTNTKRIDAVMQVCAVEAITTTTVSAGGKQEHELFIRWSCHNTRRVYISYAAITYHLTSLLLPEAEILKRLCSPHNIHGPIDFH